MTYSNVHSKSQTPQAEATKCDVCSQINFGSVEMQGKNHDKIRNDECQGPDSVDVTVVFHDLAENEVDSLDYEY